MFLRLWEFTRNNFSKAVNELYSLTDFNNDQYPDYLKWFYNTNIPRILNNTGEVIFCLDGFMVQGLSILKKTDDEKKICTFMVDKPYRNNKIGSHLLEESFKFLGTETPKITIPENKIDQFNYFINRYNWKDTNVLDKYYSPEIEFN